MKERPPLAPSPFTQAPNENRLDHGAPAHGGERNARETRSRAPKIPFQEALRRLEQTVRLEEHEKLDILAVSEGIKPAVLVTLSREADPYDTEEEGVLDISETRLRIYADGICRAMRTFGVPCEQEWGRSRYGEDGLRQFVNIYGGSDRANLERLREASKAPPEERDRQVGLALGYPPTAVEAFARGETIAREDWPRYMKDSPIAPFVHFALSREHHREEFAQCEGLMRLAQAEAPEIYRKMAIQHELSRDPLDKKEGPPKPPKPFEEALRLMEDATPNELTDDEKLGILAVAKGLKPAVSISFHRFADREKFDDISEEELRRKVRAVIGILEAFGLPFDGNWGRSTGPDGEEYQTASIYAGADEEKLARLRDALSGTGSPQEQDRALGLALGYPPTAVEAHQRGGALGRRDLPEDLRSHPAAGFLHMALSPEHYREEFEQGVRLMELARTTAPDLYRRMLRSYEEELRKNPAPPADAG